MTLYHRASLLLFSRFCECIIGAFSILAKGSRALALKDLERGEATKIEGMLQLK